MAVAGASFLSDGLKVELMAEAENAKPKTLAIQ